MFLWCQRYNPGGGGGVLHYGVRRECAPVWPENSVIGVYFHLEFSGIGVYYYTQNSGNGC